MSGFFYAVGVGPGDPLMMTLKCVKTIENSDVLVVPKSGSGTNIALKIASEYTKGKEILEVSMPMVKDAKTLEDCHSVATEQIAKILDNNKTVSFLTLGDPTIYSTVMYVHKKLTKRGYSTFVVSGVPSFCAAAASLNRSLCERDESLHIIPATYSDIDKALELDGCKVLMKSGKTITQFKHKLKNCSAKIVECATMENEKIYDCKKEFNEIPGYFSIVVIPSDNDKEK